MITMTDIKMSETSWNTINGEPRLDPAIGDIVQIIYGGGYHSSFSEPEYRLGFDDYHNKRPRNPDSVTGFVGTVVGKTSHPDKSQYILYGIQNPAGTQVIMCNRVSMECFKIIRNKEYLPEELFEI